MQELFEMLGMRLDSTREMLIFALILGRTMPLVFLAPFLGGQMVPGEIKMGLAGSLAIVVWPLARDSLPEPVPVEAFSFLLLMFKETLIGFCIGFCASHIFTAMEVAGRLIDTARGAAMGEVMVPSTRQRATVLGNLYQQLLLVFFVTFGGYRIFFEAYLLSFQQLPLTGSVVMTPGFSPLLVYMCRATAQVLYTGVILAAPAVAATFITDLVFGILNRVAPQLNAYFLSMPVKAMGALAMMLIGLGPVTNRLTIYVQDALLATERSVNLLMPR